MTEFLDRPIYFLGQPHPGILDPALLRVGERRVVLFFTDEARTRAHLSKLPNAVTVQCAADHRAKEELFGAALAQGALDLWLDAAPGGEPVLTYPLEKAQRLHLVFQAAERLSLAFIPLTSLHETNLIEQTLFSKHFGVGI